MSKSQHGIKWKETLDVTYISGFRREVEENCALLGYYAAISDNFLPTFRDNLSVQFQGSSERKVGRLAHVHRSLLSVTPSSVSASLLYFVPWYRLRTLRIRSGEQRIR